MFVLNFRLKKKNILIALAVILGIIIILTLAFSNKSDKSSPKAKSVASQAQGLADTLDKRINFLSKFGYEVTGAELTQDVVIPYEFNDVYENYNKLQLSQGFDLKDYSGLRLTQYCYEVSNYKGYDGTVYAHLLVYEGKIVGGDIAAAELDGFMHGFDKSSYYTATKKGNFDNSK